MLEPFRLKRMNWLFLGFVAILHKAETEVDSSVVVSVAYRCCRVEVEHNHVVLTD